MTDDDELEDIEVPENFEWPGLAARAQVDAAVQANHTLTAVHKNKSLFVEGLTEVLREQVEAVNNNDMNNAEAMLICQAHTLDALFNKLVQRATAQGVSGYQLELFMKTALRAQNQCRTTLQTISDIKNPRGATFVRQQNVARGHQQVNNGGQDARVKDIENEQNKVLEEQHGERLDFGAPGEAARGDSAMEAMAVQHRAQD